MHLILTGATGLVGSGVLHHILSLPPAVASAQKLTRLSILSRRPDIPLLSHPRCPKENTFTEIDIIDHPDFGSYDDELFSKLRLSRGTEADDHGDADDNDRIGIIWALGISQQEVKTSEEYVKITKTYAIEAAKAFSNALIEDDKPSTATVPQTSTGQLSAAEDNSATLKRRNRQLNFVYISGEGAQHNPSWYHPIFARVKGETEIALNELSQTAPYSRNLHVYNVRPASVDALNQPAVNEISSKRGMRNTWHRKMLERALLPPMRKGVYAGFLSPTEELGAVFVNLALGDGGSLEGEYGNGTEGWEGRVVRSSGLRQMFRKLPKQ